MANSELASALRIQGRVIWALILREVRSRYRGYRMGYVWALIEPVLHLGAWMLIMTFLGRRRPLVGDTTLIFLATGLVPFMMFQTVSNFIAFGLRANRALLSYPVVLPIDLMISRWILELATLIVVAVIIFTGIYVLGQSKPPQSYAELVAAGACMFTLALGFGVFNSSMTNLSKVYDNLWGVVSRLLYFTSGIFFVPDMLPLTLQYYVWFNPIIHGVEMFRDGYFSTFESNFPSPPYLLAWAAGLFFVGLFLERRARGGRTVSL